MFLHVDQCRLSECVSPKSLMPVLLPLASKRVNEEKFRQVTQHKSFQNRPQNECGKVDGVKSPELCVNPTETRINPTEKLTVYLTVHSPESHGIERNSMETGHSSMLSHVLEKKAHEGNKRQETEHSGSVPKCNNGEDRIRTCGTRTGSRI